MQQKNKINQNKNQHLSHFYSTESCLENSLVYPLPFSEGTTIVTICHNHIQWMKYHCHFSDKISVEQKKRYAQD